MNKKLGTVIMTLGLLLLMAAFSLTIYNLWDENRAFEASNDALVNLETQIPEEPPKEPDYLCIPGMEMPTIESEEEDYLGVLEIPVMGLKLPVISNWSYPKLRKAPCRYTGSAYMNDMIIAAHNYAKHFGNLQNLSSGDAVFFTDADGNVFSYKVVEIEVLEPTAMEEMQAGEWDLTLFTCTLGGQSRVTVRCEL